MSEDSRLEIAWRQLELENPDSIERLQGLRMKEEQKQFMRQGGNQKLEQENEQEEDQEKNYPIKEDHKQWELQNNDHLKQLFQQLGLPNFMQSFGDVKLVFLGDESLWFYRSILANISPSWKMLLESCRDTDIILLPGTRKIEFWVEVENETFWKVKDELLGEVKVETKVNYKKSHANVLHREPVNTNSKYDRENIQRKSIIEDKRTQTAVTFNAIYQRFCKVCDKKVTGGNVARHMWESHKIGNALNFQYPCSTSWNCGKIFTRAQTEAIHECRMNPSLFPSTCQFCLEKFKSEKKVHNHRRRVGCHGRPKV